MCAVRPIAPDEGFDALERDVTLAITPMPIVEPPRLVARPLVRTDSWVALARTHPLAQSDTVPFERLAREPLLLPAVHATLRANVELVFRAHGLTLHRGPETSCPAELLALVAAGAGWTLATTREELQPWDGVEVRRVAGLDRTTIALVWDPARLTAAAQRVIDTLLEITADERLVGDV
jgi:DNA-binding transcriptional LysR family regulator